MVKVVLLALLYLTFFKKFSAGGNTDNWTNWFMRILENSTIYDMLGYDDDMDTRSYGFLIKNIFKLYNLLV